MAFRATTVFRFVQTLRKNQWVKFGLHIEEYRTALYKTITQLLQ